MLLLVRIDKTKLSVSLSILVHLFTYIDKKKKLYSFKFAGKKAIVKTKKNFIQYFFFTSCPHCCPYFSHSLLHYQHTVTIFCHEVTVATFVQIRWIIPVVYRNVWTYLVDFQCCRTTLLLPEFIFSFFISSSNLLPKKLLKKVCAQRNASLSQQSCH